MQPIEPADIPHSVQQRPVVLNSKKFIRHRHVMSYRFFPIVEEGVWGPDFASH